MFCARKVRLFENSKLVVFTTSDGHCFVSSDFVKFCQWQLTAWAWEKKGGGAWTALDFEFLYFPTNMSVEKCSSFEMKFHHCFPP